MTPEEFRKLRQKMHMNSEALEKAMKMADEKLNKNSKMYLEKKYCDEIHNGYEFVDLGLSVKWATCNVGATNPTDYGDYFAWGETKPKETYRWNNYYYCNDVSMWKNYCNDGFKLIRYCYDFRYGHNGCSDDLTILEPGDDIVAINYGEGCRMPTEDEMRELENACVCLKTHLGDVNGFLYIGPNRNSIFFPAAGCYDINGLHDVGECGHYWSSSIVMDSNPSHAWGLVNNKGLFGHNRSDGCSVRPVCAK